MNAAVAILVSSYQRPQHLERVLASIAAQRGIDRKTLEVVVTDDGSRDNSRDVVAEFAQRVDFPVGFTTHPHGGFQLARCRNEGVAATTAPYLVFLDGDCLIPRDHVYQHLRRRQKNGVMAGYCCLLDERVSRRLSVDDVRAGRFTQLATAEERRKLKRMDRKARFYQLLRHASKPKLFGGNVGISRSHYLQVNGYDENFVGWGCEDDDLRLRLRAAGLRIYSILRWTHTYHLWHPLGETTPALWREGDNVAYLNRPDRSVRAPVGIEQYLDGRRSLDVTRWNVNGSRAALG